MHLSHVHMHYVIVVVVVDLQRIRDISRRVSTLVEIVLLGLLFFFLTAWIRALASPTFEQLGLIELAVVGQALVLPVRIRVGRCRCVKRYGNAA